MTPNPPPAELPAAEPEILFLGRIVRWCLRAFRVLTIGAAGYSLWVAVDGLLHAPKMAPSFVWLCIGLPPLLPLRWLFGRVGLCCLPVALVLWFGPSWLPDDHNYGYIIRMLATFVALSVLLVWRTVYRLLPPVAPQP